MSTMINRHSHEKHATCVDVAEFQRLNYFYGQLLSAQDFKIEQDFFREKMKLHNRCLHGYGCVCGLLVERVPMPPECPTPGDEAISKLREELERLLIAKDALTAADVQVSANPPAAGKPPAPADPAAAPAQVAAPAVDPGPPGQAASPQPANAPAQNTAGEIAKLDAEIARISSSLDELHRRYCKPHPRTHLRISCGLALDCQGNELILRESFLFDPLEKMSREDLQRIRHHMCKLYVSICYCEEAIDPVRPVLPDACGSSTGCAFSKTRDSVRIEVSTTRPQHKDSCETCCTGCDEPCLLLAEIDCFIPGKPLEEDQIHNDVRRPLSTYVPTKITGISWRHGHHYTQEETRWVLGTGHHGDQPHRGIEFHFSRPVHASTITPGVMDVWVIQGGRGLHGYFTQKDMEPVHLPHRGYVDHVRFRDKTGETLNAGDRILITLRASFILDHCCRAVDGDHVGGMVPLIRHEPHHGDYHPGRVCMHPPGRFGPWTSGNGTQGGTFESWFWVRHSEDQRY